MKGVLEIGEAPPPSPIHHPEPAPYGMNVFATSFPISFPLDLRYI
jgi:hypothetical protein